MRHRGSVLGHSPFDLADLLLVASVSKSLIVSGTQALDSASIPLTESLVVQILRHQQLSPAQKADFFRWASLRTEYKHSSLTYSQLFSTVCRAGQLGEILPFLNLMQRDQILVDSPTFKLLLDTVIRAGNFDLALQILEIMEDVGTVLEPYMYNSIIIAFLKKNKVSLALALFYKLLGVSEIDLPVCNGLLVALRKSGMKDEFKKVFETLRQKCFVFDTWGYNVCIHAFGCWGNLALSFGLFKEMKQRSLSSSGPDLCTYNSLIHALFIVGKVKDALIIWEELKNSGLEPDKFTYQILVHGCCKSHKLEDAIRAFREMQQNCFRPDTVTYNMLIDGLFKGKKLADACRLFEKMVQEGVRASVWTYNILIDGMIRNGRAAAAYTLFCDLKRKGQFVDGVTYSIVVLHLSREGHLQKALELVDEMQSRGFGVDLVTVSSLLVGLHKHRRWDWAEQLVKHVRDSSLVPNVLSWCSKMEDTMMAPREEGKDHIPLFESNGGLLEINNFINSHRISPDSMNFTLENGSCSEVTSVGAWSSSPYMDKLANEVQCGNYFQVFSLSKGLRVQGDGITSFDVDMLNTYMLIFLSKGKLSTACKLFEIFISMGKVPGSYTYNTLMSSFIKKGYFNQAWGVLHQMGEKLCPADIATYNLIIQGLGKMGSADLTTVVLDQLMEKGGCLDVVMYNTLISVLGKGGRIDEANRLFKQMASNGLNPDVVTFNTLIDIHCSSGRTKDAYMYLRMMLNAGCSPNHVTDTILDSLERELKKSNCRTT